MSYVNPEHQEMLKKFKKLGKLAFKENRIELAQNALDMKPEERRELVPEPSKVIGGECENCGGTGHCPTCVGHGWESCPSCWNGHCEDCDGEGVY